MPALQHLSNYNKLAKALQNYQQALELDPIGHAEINTTIASLRKQLASAHFEQGCLNTDQGNATNAIAEFNKALLYATEDFSIILKRGIAYLNNEQYAKAEEDFNKVLSQEASNPSIFKYRGQCREARNNLDKAKEDYQKAIDLNPSYKFELQPKINTILKSNLQKYLAERNYEQVIITCDLILQSNINNNKAKEIMQNIDLNPGKEETLSDQTKLTLKKHLGLTPALQQLLTALNIQCTVRYQSNSNIITIRASDCCIIAALQRFLRNNIKLDAKYITEQNELTINLKNITLELCEETIMIISQIAREELIFELSRYLTALNITLTYPNTNRATRKSLNLTAPTSPNNQRLTNAQKLTEARDILLHAIKQYRNAHAAFRYNLDTLWQCAVTHKLRRQIADRTQAAIHYQLASSSMKNLQQKKNHAIQSLDQFHKYSDQLINIYEIYTKYHIEEFDRSFNEEQQNLNQAYEQQNIADELVQQTELNSLREIYNPEILARLRHAKNIQNIKEANTRQLEQQMQKLWDLKEKTYKTQQDNHWKFISDNPIDYLWFKHNIFSPALRTAVLRRLEQLPFTYIGNLQIIETNTLNNITRIVFNKLQDANIITLLNNQEQYWQKHLCIWLQNNIAPIENDTTPITFTIKPQTLLRQENNAWINELTNIDLRDTQPIDDNWWQENLISATEKINWYALSIQDTKGILGADFLPFIFAFISNSKLPSKTLIWEIILGTQNENEQLQPSAPPISDTASTTSSFKGVANFFKPSAPSLCSSAAFSNLSSLSERIRPTAPPLTDDLNYQTLLAQFRHTYLGADLPTNNHSINEDALTVNYDAQLGQGGYGTVYKGCWGPNNTAVAVKELTASHINENSTTTFNNEIKLMADLRHPNITQFFGVCIARGKCSLVMEYMSRGSLYSTLHSNNNLSLQSRYKIAQDITSGLYYLHIERKIAHGDLTSSNVLLDINYNAKLADFGLSTLKPKSSDVQKGTLPYIAPEQASENVSAINSIQADMYSYGIILCELLTNKAPYADIPKSEVKNRIRNGQHTEIPQALAQEYPEYFQLIFNCWHMNPEKRPTIKDAANILQTILRENDLTDLHETGNNLNTSEELSGPIYRTNT